MMNFLKTKKSRKFLCNSNTFVKNICENAGLQSAASLHGSAWTAGSIANKIGKLPDGKYAESERNLQFGPRTFEDGNKWSLSEKLKQEFIDKQQNEIDSELNNNYDSTSNSLKTEVSTELRYSFDGCFTEIDTGSSENKIFASKALLNKTPKDDPKYKEVSRLVSLAQKIVCEKYGIHRNKLIPIILRGSNVIETDDVKKMFSLTGANAAYYPSYDCIAVNKFNIYDLNSCNDRKKLLSTLAHEFTHATLGNNLSGTAGGILPNWLNEGLATNAENPGSRSEDKIKYMTNLDLYDDQNYHTYDFYTLNNKLTNKWLGSNNDQHELIKNMIEIMNEKSSNKKVKNEDYKDYFKANNGNEAEKAIIPQLQTEYVFKLNNFKIQEKEDYVESRFIKISDNIKKIPEGAFKDCVNLRKIEIPASVTSIDNGAFLGCKNLKNVTIPEGVTSIGACVFDYCKNLEEITIPEGVTSIGKRAFYYCLNLEEITIPASVTSIGESAFYYCLNLKEITIPEGVTSIGNGVFSYCTNLENITIPEGVTSIGEGAFCGCKNLKEITIPASVTSIGESAFDYCKNLEEITIPEGVTSIGKNAFSYCKNLENITIPEGVTSIGNGAFSYCENLENITIPEGVTSIGDGAFSYCKNLENIIIPASVTSIDNGAFLGCKNLKEITIPEGVTSIGEITFYKCENLKEITIPASVTNIDAGAFMDCKNLENITIPASVISIGKMAFFGCENLKEITIPASVTSIGESAFKDCTNLKSVTILGKIDSLDIQNVFECCDKLLSDPDKNINYAKK